ncbi:hypothetical protein BFU36_00170 [Sulfolobus sp. A20]|uniref:DUF973 family protein n=1 Tax=Sulfolobaceae TaxID=118883 RepID=UPI000845DA5C|nr:MULTISPECIES: DUF973 family protein [unclassified Sulfolobus]TRM75308.1 DUF973 domain-containing protein [Sulfolobus sp. E5]TRM77690.1 DUF973 domain-containing protein [Sulfolobus sp. A20-N-F8]TRM79562.1 DUF973 domain-containing protein [Sulfolobus sp. B5]TRM81928.1 DUF973 domain-containing protein [Sulfolobus sp. D5]TRM87633.1 DUF973 domain-containing protein [Sulfolobus sp. C3]TRN00996.1 DUF973 domain-containing protein [Sulfolobus sp. F1]TRN03394.1 DUF973 domain-containing protein [Sul
MSIEISGIEKLKEGSLFYLILLILGVVLPIPILIEISLAGALIETSLAGALATGLSQQSGSSSLISPFSSGLLFLGILLSGIIVLFSLFFMFYWNSIKGFYSLIASGKKDVRGGIYSLNVILIGGVVILAGVVTSFSSIYFLNIAQTLLTIGIILGVIGFVVGSVGFIILGLNFSALGRIYFNSSVRNAGLMISSASILFLVGSVIVYLTSPEFASLIHISIINLTITIIGIFIGILSSSVGYTLDLIGFITLYSNLKEPTNILNTSPEVLQQSGVLQQRGFVSEQYGSQQVRTISEIVSGTLSSSGIARLSIYSQHPLQILSATLVGSELTTNDITPSELKVGINDVIINFKTALVLSKGSMYSIELLLSNGQKISAKATYN